MPQQQWAVWPHSRERYKRSGVLPGERTGIIQSTAQPVIGEARSGWIRRCLPLKQCTITAEMKKRLHPLTVCLTMQKGCWEVSRLTKTTIRKRETGSTPRILDGRRLHFIRGIADAFFLHQSRVSTHSANASFDIVLSNLVPENHVTSSETRSWRFSTLEPISLLPEVQNGTMVFPEKE